jgi:hypothetical protein
MPVIFNELFNDAQRTSELFLREGSYENHPKNRDGGIQSPTVSQKYGVPNYK